MGPETAAGASGVVNDSLPTHRCRQIAFYGCKSQK